MAGSQANTCGKHVWQPEEDKVLVDCLVEMRQEQKFMQGSNFRPGFLQHIALMMEQRLPGCGIKDKPHIQSRLKTLKTVWGIVHDMVFNTNTSGFGWDADKKCMTAEKEVWDEYLKTHQKVAPYRNRAFPHFDELCIVWGNDHATGRDAQSTCDVNEETDPLPEDGGLGDIEYTGADAKIDASVGFTEVTPVNTCEASSTRKKRKRNQDGLLASAIDRVGGSIESSIKTLCSHVDKLAHEYEMNAMRVRLAAELAKVQGLTQREYIQAHLKLAAEEKLMVAFTGMLDDLKLAWIRELIG